MGYMLTNVTFFQMLWLPVKMVCSSSHQSKLKKETYVWTEEALTYHTIGTSEEDVLFSSCYISEVYSRSLAKIFNVQHAMSVCSQRAYGKCDNYAQHVEKGNLVPCVLGKS